jgi:hypothetical protein
MHPQRVDLDLLLDDDKVTARAASRAARIWCAVHAAPRTPGDLIRAAIAAGLVVRLVLESPPPRPIRIGTRVMALLIVAAAVLTMANGVLWP